MPEIGQVLIAQTIDQRGNRWYLVEIGRSRKVKRFYLSPQEAAELRDRLATILASG